MACAISVVGCAVDASTLEQETRDALHHKPDAEGSCGDGVLQADEECDLGDKLVSDGSRGLPKGTIYDEWNCNPNTCRRRYIYTPCVGVGWSIADCPEGFCDGSVCQPLAKQACASWGIENPIVKCRIEETWDGLCGLDRCFASCTHDQDCPHDTVCDILYEGHADKVCQVMRPR
jgi:hypothetical protein